MPGPRDRCLQDALDEFEKTGQDPIPGCTRQADRWFYRRASDGKWIKKYSSEWLQHEAMRLNPFGRKGPKWYSRRRNPDWLLKCGDDVHVVDNKFKGDRWRGTQKKDYAEIEKAQGGKGEPKAVTAEECACDPKKDYRRVYELEPEPAPKQGIPYGVPLPIPFRIPGPWRLPTMPTWLRP